MGFFKEEGVDVLDLTLLKKKGILKIREAPREAEIIDLTKMDRDGFAPLSDSVPAPSLVSDAISTVNFNSSSSSSTSASAGGTTFASFWDAPVNAPPSSVGSFDSNTNSSSSSSVSSSSDIDVRNFGVKIEDVEYKMERLSEKLLALEAKIDEIARNIR